MSGQVGSSDERGSTGGSLEDASNILLLVPSLATSGRATCLDLLLRTPPEETNVLGVTYTRSAESWARDWTERVGTPPARGGIVTVGQNDAEDLEGWTVDTVENPADLTSTGIGLSERLAELATAEDSHLSVCFDSVTSLMQYADLQRTFRFLHVVTGRVTTAGGTAHYHLDPEAHDQQALATMRGLFDAVVTVDDDGSVSVER